MGLSIFSIYPEESIISYAPPFYLSDHASKSCNFHILLFYNHSVSCYILANSQVYSFLVKISHSANIAGSCVSTSSHNTSKTNSIHLSFTSHAVPCMHGRKTITISWERHLWIHFQQGPFMHKIVSYRLSNIFSYFI